MEIWRQDTMNLTRILYNTLGGIEKKTKRRKKRKNDEQKQLMLQQQEVQYAQIFAVRLCDEAGLM
ncbi:hypothetical protein E2C01_099617 [Portunus trituberculatus]|uniref:Uncharacterized protein n=1 Tax=Portunus trituberculatus TaxID=210409 RepID=A0A5B7KAW5_PORTR|nr:hypothetical protein [Portunus trituberculatus]